MGFPNRNTGVFLERHNSFYLAFTSPFWGLRYRGTCSYHKENNIVMVGSHLQGQELTAQGWWRATQLKVAATAAAAAAKSLQSCLTLCDPMDCSLPGFSIHGILQIGRAHV